MISETLISMGKCVACGESWEMTSSEKDWWDKKVREDGWVVPKRCKECRELKKQSKSLTSIPDLIRTLRDMSLRAINDDYDEHGDLLSQELADLAGALHGLQRSAECQIQSSDSNISSGNDTTSY